MTDARYLRSQAELCLHMAKVARDDHVADNLRSAAAEYFLRATECEGAAVVLPFACSPGRLR
jgi:hypothetical protein